MRIAIFVTSLSPVGPVLVAHDLCQELVLRGHEVVVYYFKNKFGLDFPCVTKKMTFHQLWKMSEFDVIHSNSLRPDAVAWLLKNIVRTRSRFVCTVHNYVEQDLTMLYGRGISRVISPLWRLLWRGLDAVAVLTKDAQVYYKRTFPPVISQVVHNARRVSIIRSIDAGHKDYLGSLRSRFTVVGANAAVLKRKGFHHVIEALVHLPNHVFVLVGDGPELSYLRGLAVSLGVSSRFISLGYQSNACAYLEYYHVYVMPSVSEGMPLAMLEAVDAGVPVVCSRISVFEELFNSDEVNYFVVNDPASLVEALQVSPDVLKLRAELAKARLVSSYTVEKMTDGYLQIYRC